jgi:hypothetical protein
MFPTDEHKISCSKGNYARPIPPFHRKDFGHHAYRIRQHIFFFCGVTTRIVPTAITRAIWMNWKPNQSDIIADIPPATLLAET